MKKLFLIITLSLITVMCTGLGLVGCDWLSGLNPDHTHIPSTNWYSDSTYHWHNCTALGCSEQLDKAEHTLAYVESRQATCTEDGNVEYWYCTVCGKCYADENATTELNTVTLSATGHKIVTEYDESTHWQECEICHTVIVSAQAHSSTSYVKSKSGHYKICDDCGAIYDEGTHIDGEACLICGYTPDYADICSSEYGYNYLGTLEGGTSYQGFYEKIDEVASAFHNDETQTAEPVTFSGGIAYVAGAINYSSFGLSLTQAESVWATYRNDHPLYYWLSGRILYTSQSLSLCVDGDYKDGAVRRAQNEEIYSVIDGYLNAVGGETEAYQIAFAFHDMIIDSIDYARDESGNPVSESWAHGVSGVFAKGEAVCEGYAKAFSLLLNVSGVENVYVTGTSKGEGHAWNMVKIDGEWYWYDLTWDDQPHLGDGIIYDYMCQAG
ncbi:MAG: transglutaminase domain-containing protein, partial [Candidatus Coproplasma sp.]